MASQPIPWNTRWLEVPICLIDVETTGVRPGRDRVVEVGLARFERGLFVGGACSRINPGIPIPPDATAIHGITDADVADAPTLEEYFARPEPMTLLRDAQPAGYNGNFDRNFIPPAALADWTWPWLDPMVLVRHIDKKLPGKGKYKLTAACARHGVQLEQAHNAGADARAAGELLFVLAKPRVPEFRTMGEFICSMRQREAEQWIDFHSWLARQPPIEGEGTQNRP